MRIYNMVIEDPALSGGLEVRSYSGPYTACHAAWVYCTESGGTGQFYRGSMFVGLRSWENIIWIGEYQSGNTTAIVTVRQQDVQG